jgi:hypothetical protein
MFERLIWREDRMLLDNLVFRLEHHKDSDLDTDTECFAFYKIKKLVDQYHRFLAMDIDLRPANIFELGIWDGGSIAFWFECFQPKKHVAIDLSERGDSSYFRNYIKSRGLTERVKTYWGVDQADAEKVRYLVKNEFADPLDLVIDDASHFYLQTKESFETLFPELRPGGWYIIEDWAWEHWKEFHAIGHPWAAEQSLTKLIFELVEATGTSTELIASMVVYEGFVAVERGIIKRDELGDFNLNNYIARRPGHFSTEETAQLQEQKLVMEALGAVVKEWEPQRSDAKNRILKIVECCREALLQRLWQMWRMIKTSINSTE